MAQGVMYVEILPSTKGIGKAVEKDTTSAFKGAEKTGQGFFSRVGKWAKGSALVVGGMVATIGGLAIKGGISRALNIEDATAKLKGLGHDTKSVDQIMTDALASVKGTAFGLDAAATTAASAVAAGIKPGQELEKYLRLTADAATIAGVSMDEMGDLMNKVAAKGKVSAREINQFTERGIPILQMLADEYGVTAEEMSSMVSRGEVDAERFRKALEDNVGGAALASGDTTRGAFANMMAALSRLGLAFVGDGLAGAKTFFQEVTIIFDGLNDRIGPWVEKFQGKLGDMFTIEGMGENFLDWLDETIEKVASGPIPQLLNALQPIIPVIADLASMLGEALGDAFFELGEALAPIIPLIAEELVDAIVTLAPPLTDILIALLPIIPSLVELLEVVVPLAAELLDELIPAIEWMAEVLANDASILSDFIDLLSGDIGVLEFANGILSMEGPLGDFYRWLYEGIEAVVLWVKGVVDGVVSVYENVVAFIGGVRDFFASAWEAIGLNLGGALKTIVGLVTGNMALARDGVSQGLDAIRGWWKSTWNGIVSFFGGIWSRIGSSVSSGISNVVGFMSSLPGRIMGAVSALPGMLVSVGQQMIQGLINGVRGMIDQAVSAVKNVGGAMLEGVQSFLGIKSPSRVFRDQVGKMVGLGLLDGIEDSSIHGRIDNAVRHLVEVPNVVGTAGGRTVSMENKIYMQERDPRVVLRQLGRELNGALA